MKSVVAKKKSVVYRALCQVLSDQIDAVPWSSFTPADWDLLPRMAQTEGVAPLMHWKLKEASAGAGLPTVPIPPAVRTALADAFYSNVVSNTLLFRELDRILAALNEANIPVIVLKGAALAQTLYPNPGLRPMGDLFTSSKASSKPR